MIDNNSLRQAFGSLERHTPAETEVLAGVHQGIRQRRRRRQLASVLGVAGAASLVALGVVLVAPGQGADQGGTRPAAAPPPSTTVAQAPPGPALPFTVGWLPRGYTLDAWDAGDTSGSAQYVGSGDFQTIVVWISDEPRDPVEGAVDEPATIAGRPGTIRRLAPDRADTQLIWQLADGRWAMVGGRVPTVSAEALGKVARSLSPRPTPLDVTLGLRALPDGYQVAGWTGPGEGSVLLCPSAVDVREDGRPADCVNVDLRPGAAPATVPRPIAENGDKTNVVEVPLGQKQVVDGVVTRAIPDGTLAAAQVGPGHWVQAFSPEAGVDVLRKAAALATVR